MAQTQDPKLALFLKYSKLRAQNLECDCESQPLVTESSGEFH